MNKLRIEYTKKMEYNQSKAARIIPVAVHVLHCPAHVEISPRHPVLWTVRKRIQVPAVGLFPGLDRSLEDNLIPFGVDALSLMIPECFVGIAIAGSGC